MKIKNLKQIVSVASMFLVLCSYAPQVQAGEIPPYQKAFRISAYYSPLPNQSVYFRGSYDADRRLNGNGTHGADGTPVYVGMLAAPKSYTFGTKLAIPGLGVGAIHDRGGAIVTAGERGNSFDRIDVWMGAGEEGLARALQWGMRTVTATIYPADFAIAESFELPNYQKKLVADLKLGDTGQEIKTLQTELKTYGYYQNDITGNFDDTTKTALANFQIARGLVGSLDDPSAGIFGAKTRAVLNQEIAARNLPTANLLASSVLQSGAATTNTGNANSVQAQTDARFPVSLSSGDRGDRVRELQIALTKIGAYECEVNGVFDEKTATCLTQFQVQQKIIASEKDFGAGVFGPQTRMTLTTALDTYEKQLNQNVANALVNVTLDPSDANTSVTTLQNGLKKLGYLNTDATGKFDDATTSALANFQVAEKILGTTTSYGAGHFGPKTKTVFNDKLRTALLALPTPLENPKLAFEPSELYTPKFDRDLTLGDTGASVTELQNTLKQLGNYSADPSGTYDDTTLTAVTQFQLATKIIQSEKDLGAGVLGPKTRAALNATVTREKVALVKTASKES